MVFYESYYGVMPMEIDPIVHHGILGQKWGVRRFQNRDGSRTSKGKARDRQTYKTRRKGLSDRQKRAIKTGLKVVGGAVVVGAAAYGAYKLSEMSGGKTFTRPVGDLMKGDIPGKSINRDIDLDRDIDDLLNTYRKMVDADSNVASLNEGKTLQRLGSSEIPKSMHDMFGTLSKDNPLRKADDVNMNCTNVFLAAIGRLKGYDVTPGWQKDQSGNFTGAETDSILSCFKRQTDSLGNPILKTSKGEHFSSYEDACKVLQNPRFKYGEGATGYIASTFISPLNGKEQKHAFTWRIENGTVKFGDGVNGEAASQYFKFIKKDAVVDFFRADDNEFIDSEFRKHVIYR